MHDDLVPVPESLEPRSEQAFHVPTESVPPLEFRRDQRALATGIGFLAGGAVAILAGSALVMALDNVAARVVLVMVILVAGLVLPIIGMIRLARARRYPVSRDVLNPYVQAALDDAAWDPTGYTLSGHERALRWLRGQTVTLIVIGLGCLFIGGFISVAAQNPAWMMLMAAGPVTWVVLRWVLMYWFGDTRVTFTQFPYTLGEPVRFLFRSEGGSGIFHSLQFRLRYVGLLDTGRWTSSNDLPYSVALTEQWELPAPGSDIEVTLDCPREYPYGSGFSESPPAEWYVEVKGKTRAGAFEELFPIPIYVADVEEPEPPTAPPPRPRSAADGPPLE